LVKTNPQNDAINEIKMQTFNTVPDIRIEFGGASNLANHLVGLGESKRVIIITDKGISNLGLISKGLNSLESEGYTVMVYDEVVADPPEEMVLSATERIKKFNPGVIIGFGGGSPMDTAKVIAHLCIAGTEIKDLYGVNRVNNQRLPLILIPTTAGTGSEVTNVAIITTGSTAKEAIVANSLYADRVLLDAKLTMGLPKQITAATGIDAMVHAIEAYTSVIKKNPLSDTYAIAALRKLHSAIIPACIDGNDLEARNQMLLGAMLAGQAFTNAPVGAVHGLAYPLGGFFHVPHGLSNALVLTEVMEYNLPKADHWYGQLARELKVGDTGMDLIEEMKRIKVETGVPQTLSEVGIPANAIPDMAKDAMHKTRVLRNNPVKMTYDAAVGIYERIL
jgi:alcohol dehydrogenase